MKKGILSNQPISNLIAGLGHTDEIVIADVGLPIPEGTKRIDLALTRGLPSFELTLKTILVEMFVEKAFVSQEIETYSPEVMQLIQEALGNVPVVKIPHLDFKARTSCS